MSRSLSPSLPCHGFVGWVHLILQRRIPLKAVDGHNFASRRSPWRGENAMTRISRSSLVLVVAVVLALTSVPFASARPLATSGAFERTVDNWIGAAVRWMEGFVGLQRPTSERAASSPAPTQKDVNTNGATG